MFFSFFLNNLKRNKSCFTSKSSNTVVVKCLNFIVFTHLLLNLFLLLCHIHPWTFLKTLVMLLIALTAAISPNS